jgi:hypothetical protein
VGFAEKRHDVVPYCVCRGWRRFPKCIKCLRG